MKEKCIAIIPARGGSKRIPRKNIRDFCGKPIIAYSIEAALGAGIFDEVMVSTDDAEIAEIARKYGARVPFMRSSETADDHATTADVLNEVLNCYKSIGREFYSFACLYPTAPFMTAERLKEAFMLMKDTEAGEVISVVKYDFPPQRAFIINDGLLAFQYPEFALKRSQDLRPIYHDGGQFYFYEMDAWINKKGILCDKTVPFILNMMEVQDIDTLSDWEIAEDKMNALRKKS